MDNADHNNPIIRKRGEIIGVTEYCNVIMLPSELSGNSLLLQEALKKKIAEKLQEKLKKMRPDMSDNDRAAALALLEGKDSSAQLHSLHNNNNMEE